jgi:dihydropteroate synthase
MVNGLPDADRCLVMGVVNVTPDSFSDGGQWYGAEAAISRGLELVEQGADIVDVGGESTRPGAQRITVEEELRRVGPVLTELAKAGVPVSVDTMRAQVAEFALEAGANLVNDVSGGLADPYMPRLVAKAAVPYVVMHWRGHSHDMDSRAIYTDVVREVHDELARRVDAVTAEGVDPALIVLDPGLGFSKQPEHNWRLLTHLDEVRQIGGVSFPVLVGASRKRFLGKLLAGPDGAPRSPGRCRRTTAAAPHSPPPRAPGASGYMRCRRTRTRYASRPRGPPRDDPGHHRPGEQPRGPARYRASWRRRDNKAAGGGGHGSLTGLRDRTGRRAGAAGLPQRGARRANHAAAARAA